MSRPKSEPTYHVHKRSGRAFTIIDRKQIPLGKAGTPESFNRFDKLRAQWLANGRTLPQEKPDAPTPGSRGPTIAVLLEAFWRHALAYYSRPALSDAGEPVLNPDGTPNREPTEQLPHFRQVVKLLNRLYGDTATADFGCPELEAVRAAMIDPPADPVTGARPAGWCRKHANRQVGRVKAIFAWGVTKKLVPVNVHAELLLLPGLRKGAAGARETKPVRAIDTARALALIPHTSKQVGAMIRLHLLTGMRSTEICLMRPIDIDRTGKPWVYRPTRHKTEGSDIPREVRLGPKARKVLRPFLKGRAPAAFIFSPKEAAATRHARQRKARKSDVQPSQVLRAKRAAARKHAKRPAERYDRRSYYAAIRYATEKAFGMPAEYREPYGDRLAKSDTPDERAVKLQRRRERNRLRAQWHAQHRIFPHLFRHTSATTLRKGGGLEVAQVQLGHTSKRTTEIYAEADVAKTSEVVEQIG